ncbi:MAG TPA: c-type cytochrome domain-containing protein, partial [Pirellulales bacterium]|nr:c-type cytochrome domain-containing protein [Pirellulales bacterium]
MKTDRSLLRLSLLPVAVACALAASALGEEKAPAAKLSSEHEEFFEKRIRPMLAEHCVSCHGAETQEAGLRLDSRDFFMKGMEGEPVAVAGHPDRSRLIAVTRYDGNVQMPPDGKLSEQDFETLVTWVKMGLPWPQHAEPQPAAAAPTADPKQRYPELRATHWAFQPVVKTHLPQVKNRDWCKNPIDQYILAKLEAVNLAPSPSVDRRTLLRRVTVDLTGLPPTS